MKIGLTYTGDPEKHINYKQWIEGNENIQAVRLQTGDELNNPDGLVFSGGIDIHPAFYDGNENYPKAPLPGWEVKRDEFELAALRYAFDNNIPVLGICRGLQLINVFLKGSLLQDLGDDRLNPVHEGEPDKKHPVNIHADTLLNDITNQRAGEVNSAHHQAIDRLGEGLVVNARSPEGIIEGIEWKDAQSRPFMLGVQWHPERMFEFNLQESPFSKAVRDRFIEEVRKAKKYT